MSLRIITWVLDNSESKLGARLVLLALADYAHDDGSKAFPAVETLARKARLSERGTRDALRKLEADGMIRQTGQTKKGTNIYTIIGPFNEAAVFAPPAESARSVSQTAPDLVKDPPGSTPAELRVRIEQTWLSSEGMIAHRESYFADAKVRRAIDKAVKTYGADDVCAAITSYAAVLASPQHRWSHRWTLLDFLTRGLDRFVPEAEPEVVFRDNGVAGGRPGNDNAEDDGLDYLNT